ncbi:uncharacterized protein PG986_014191 [Apiospora aurea]|uniref:Zn(2)-C6 fungal-type domain-containing protein n=1 Tax=Apiospora aurea TaxID=335848 RepID=A0ABR1PSB6_9PEZI
MASSTFRRLLPKDEASSVPNEPAEPVKKRKLVSLACARCRSHKTKCDGQRPSCGSCRARSVDCTYDDDPNTTPTANLRRQYHHLAEQHQSFHELFGLLRSRPEDEALIILQRLRSSGNVQSTLHHVKEGYLLADSRMVGTEANDVPFPPCPKNREEVMLGVYHSNAYPFLPPSRRPNLRSATRCETLPRPTPTKTTGPRPKKSKTQTSDWTTVTDSDTIVRNLISLYLSWDHATMRLFDEDLFLDQMSAGKKDYCSPVFVNALLAVATLNYSSIDHDLCQDLGPKFFEEARQLWESDSEQQPRLLLVPTATLLSMWCYSNGDENTGVEFSNESIRIGIDLGLFRTLPREPTLCDDYMRIMIRGEAMVAWGLFNWHSVHSFFRRRALDLPNPPYHPALYDPERHEYGEVVWNSFPLRRPRHHLHRDLTSRAFSELWTIIWEGTERPHQRQHYSAASASSSASVSSPEYTNDAKARQFFHAIMVQLFRPFANFDFPGQANAKAVTQASLSQMRRIIYTQRYRYGGPPFSSTTVGSIHLFTSSLLEELAKSDDVDPHARFYLVLAAEEMKRCGDAFPFIHKVLHQLLSEARSDGTRLPPDLDDMFDDLEARLSGHTRLAIFPQKYPIVFRLGISDQVGGETDDIINATYRLRLGDSKTTTTAQHEQEVDRMMDGVVDGVVDGAGSGSGSGSISSRAKDKGEGKGKGRRQGGGGE